MRDTVKDGRFHHALNSEFSTAKLGTRAVDSWLQLFYFASQIEVPLGEPSDFLGKELTTGGLGG